MDAFFAKNRLSAYLDGALQPREAAEVEEAIARDPALRAELDAMKQAVHLLRTVGPTQAPPDLHRKIMARVAAEPAPGGRLVWLFRPLSRVPVEALAVAAAALLVVLAIQVKHGADEAPQVALQEAEEQGATLPAPLPGTDPAPEPLATAKGPLLAPTTTTAPPRTTAKTPKKTELAPTPEVAEAPYAPDWDATPTPTTLDWDRDPALETEPGTARELSQGVAMRTALYYALSTSDPEVLAQLADLARKAGGQLQDGNGDPLAEGASAGGSQKVQLVLPPGSLAEVERGLRGLGARSNSPPPAAALYNGETVTLVVQVQWSK